MGFTADRHTEVLALPQVERGKDGHAPALPCQYKDQDDLSTDWLRIKLHILRHFNFFQRRRFVTLLQLIHISQHLRDGKE